MKPKPPQLLQEIETALNGREQLTYSELTELKYMDAVVKETMRIFPAVCTYLRT